MLMLIKRLLGRSPNTDAPQALLLSSDAPTRGGGLDLYQGEVEAGDFAITRYPPFDAGIPVIAVDTILLSQQDLIDRIFRTAGVSREEFARMYQQPIVNLARHVHLLPATSTTYFRGTGGLFRMSLEIALNTLQSANAAVFPTGGGVERRFLMLPKWTLACFLAGLCSQNYRTVNSMAVLTRSNAQWSPLLDPLYEWCASERTDVYFVRWMEDAQVRGAQASAAYSISQVIPHDVLQYLASDNNQVVPAMTAAVAGVDTNTSENPISRLVAPVITRVIEDDLKRSATNYGHLVIGAHLEMHLLDAMRRLVKTGKWIANNAASGGRLWVGQEGVFIDWPVAAGDIATLLARDSFAGIPKDPDTLADLLVSASLLQLTKEGGRYWTIATPVTMESREGMVKLREGTVIFPQGFDFTPYHNVQLTLTAAPKRAPAKAVSANAPATTTPPPKAESGQSAIVETETEAMGAAAIVPMPAPDSVEPPAPTSATVEHMTSPEVVCEPPANPTCPDTETLVPAMEEGAEAKKSAKHHHRKPRHAHIPQEAAKQEKSPATMPEPDVTLGSAQLGATAEKLLGSLKRGNAWLLQEVVTAYRNGALAGEVAVLPHGVGISHEELNRHGLPVMELLEELALKSWLWQDKTRSMRRIHPVEVDGKTRRLMILKHDIAAGLGFDVERKD